MLRREFGQLRLDADAGGYGEDAGVVNRRIAGASAVRPCGNFLRRNEVAEALLRLAVRAFLLLAEKTVAIQSGNLNSEKMAFTDLEYISVRQIYHRFFYVRDNFII